MWWRPQGLASQSQAEKTSQVISDILTWLHKAIFTDIFINEIIFTGPPQLNLQMEILPTSNVCCLVHLSAKEKHICKPR